MKTNKELMEWLADSCFDITESVYHEPKGEEPVFGVAYLALEELFAGMMLVPEVTEAAQERAIPQEYLDKAADILSSHNTVRYDADGVKVKKIYAVADMVPKSTASLIEGKEYEVQLHSSGTSFFFTDEYGFRQQGWWEESCHLGGGNWRRVER